MPHFHEVCYITYNFENDKHARKRWLRLKATCIGRVLLTPLQASVVFRTLTRFNSAFFSNQSANYWTWRLPPCLVQRTQILDCQVYNEKRLTSSCYTQREKKNKKTVPFQLLDGSFPFPLSWTSRNLNAKSVTVAILGTASGGPWLSPATPGTKGFLTAETYHLRPKSGSPGGSRHRSSWKRP